MIILYTILLAIINSCRPLFFLLFFSSSSFSFFLATQKKTRSTVQLHFWNGCAWLRIYDIQNNKYKGTKNNATVKQIAKNQTQNHFFAQKYKSYEKTFRRTPEQTEVYFLHLLRTIYLCQSGVFSSPFFSWDQFFRTLSIMFRLA